MVFLPRSPNDKNFKPSGYLQLFFFLIAFSHEGGEWIPDQSFNSFFMIFNSTIREIDRSFVFYVHCQTLKESG